jgi:DNA phosphorothioation-dependent restriction protein DptF
MYKMILSINQGYRPNKHDRNSIIIFEELLEKIADKVKNANELVFTKNKTDFTFTNNIDEIEVSKHVN